MSIGNGPEIAGPEHRPVIDFDYVKGNSQSESDAHWKALREKCPIGWSPLYGGHWVLSRYDEISEAFRNWELFSSKRVDPEYLGLEIIPMKMPLMNPQELDPPVWTKYRRVLSPLLSPLAAERLQPQIAKWVSHYLDQVIETGQIDFVYDLASPVPGAIVLEWLGFPAEDWQRISRAFHNVTGHPPGSSEHERALEDLGWLEQRIAEEVADRRGRPRDDAICAIVNEDLDDGEPMSSEYAAAMVRVLIAGGVDTTTSVTASALVHLHFHPDDRQALIDEPTLIDHATEEFLRCYPPARTIARTVTKDVEFAGCSLYRGDRVLLSEASACYDERAFPDAERFLINRFPNRHLAFGMGIHRCPGSHLARLEFKEMLTQVLQRIPDYQVIEEDLVTYPSWGIVGGWSRATAVFTPGPRRD
jgi:cytochrome P450